MGKIIHPQSSVSIRNPPSPSAIPAFPRSENWTQNMSRVYPDMCCVGFTGVKIELANTRGPLIAKLCFCPVVQMTLRRVERHLHYFAPPWKLPMNFALDAEGLSSKSINKARVYAGFFRTLDPPESSSGKSPPKRFRGRDHYVILLSALATKRQSGLSFRRWILLGISL